MTYFEELMETARFAGDVRDWRETPESEFEDEEETEPARKSGGGGVWRTANGGAFTRLWRGGGEKFADGSEGGAFFRLWHGVQTLEPFRKYDPYHYPKGHPKAGQFAPSPSLSSEKARAVMQDALDHFKAVIAGKETLNPQKLLDSRAAYKSVPAGHPDKAKLTELGDKVVAAGKAAGVVYAGGGKVKVTKPPSAPAPAVHGTPHPIPASVPQPQAGTWKDAAELAGLIAQATGLTKEQIRAAVSGHAKPSSAAAQHRAKIADAILSNGWAKKDAILEVMKHHDEKENESFVKSIAQGDVQRAIKEYGQTPLYDLQVLGGIRVESHPVHGQAFCKMLTREVIMGSTSVTGDFRHELGHAVRAAMAGEAHQKNALTQAVADHYEQVKQRMKEHPEGRQTKMPYEWYETTYGVIGRRGTDNWEEDFAEHYRGYHRELYRDRNEGGGGKFLQQYRARHPQMAALFDAHYTAAWLGALARKGEI
jgi:hypothetical protein